MKAGSGKRFTKRDWEDDVEKMGTVLTLCEFHNEVLKEAGVKPVFENCMPLVLASLNSHLTSPQLTALLSKWLAIIPYMFLTASHRLFYIAV